MLATAIVVAAHFAMRRTASAATAERLPATGRVAYPVVLLFSNAALVAIFWGRN